MSTPNSKNDQLVGRSIPSALQIDRELARRSLQYYVEQIAPNYRFGKFHGQLAAILTRFALGEIPNLIIQAPPQHGKSELFSRLLPGYLFALHGGIDVLATSYGNDLARKNSMAARRYIDSDEYRRLFPHVGGQGDRMSTQLKFETSQGSYLGASISSGLTGNGGSFILIDDPLKNRQEADSATTRDAIWAEYTSSILTRWRRHHPVGSRTVRGGIGLTLTRWHDDDLAGRLIELGQDNPEADQWEVFNFPAIAD